MGDLPTFNWAFAQDTGKALSSTLTVIVLDGDHHNGWLAVTSDRLRALVQSQLHDLAEVILGFL